MENPPFPPYTSAGVSQRFPNDAQARQSILCLKMWLADREPRASVAAAFGRSEVALYRLRHRWAEQGITALLGAARSGPAQSFAPRQIQQVLRRLFQASSFVAGQSALSEQLLPTTRDPAERGRRLDQAARAAVAAVDTALADQHAAGDLLAQHLIHGRSIAELAQRHYFSPRHMRRIIDQGLAELQAELPRHAAGRDWAPWAAFELGDGLIGRAASLAALEQGLHAGRAMRLLGLSGIGKSSLAAALARRWHTAGWNVVWINCPDERGADERIIAGLYAQLAACGAVASATPDPWASAEQHLDTLAYALGLFPVLCIIDDVQRLPAALGRWLTALAAQTPALRLLLAGHSCALPLGEELILSGLDRESARRIYEEAHQPRDDSGWPAAYAATRGNPKLLRLLRHASSAEPAALAGAVLAEHSRYLSRPARRLLVWLAYWDGPIERGGAYAQAAPGTQNDWAELLQRGLLTMREQAVHIHDLVRGQRELFLSASDVRDLEQSILGFAEQHRLWDLAYRCAAGRAEALARISRQAAGQAAAQGNLHEEQRWSVRLAEATRAAGDGRAGAAALLAACDCALALFDTAAARELLGRLPGDLPAGHAWWRGYYELEVFRLTQDFDRADELLAGPTLSAGPPAGDEVATWRWSLLQSRLAWARDDLRRSWDIFRAMEPPPAGVAAYHRLGYYDLGAQLSEQFCDYDQQRHWIRMYRRVARQMPSPLYQAQSEYTYITMLDSHEAYVPALRITARLIKSLDPSWLALGRKVATRGAFIAMTLGDLRRGQQWIEQAAALNQRLGWHNHDTMVKTLIIQLHIDCHQLDEAGRLLSQPLETMDLNTLFWYSEWLRRRNDRPRLAAAWAAILRHLRAQRLRAIAAHVHVMYGDAMRLAGRPDNALRHYRRGREYFASINRRHHVIEAMGRIAECLAERGEYAEANAISELAMIELADLPCGLLFAPRVCLGHARLLDAQGRDSAAAWSAALDHLSVQLKHLPRDADPAMFASEPFNRAILDHFGGLEAVRRGWRKSGRPMMDGRWRQAASSQ